MFDPSDMIKMAAFHALTDRMKEMKDGEDDVQKKRDTWVPHFENESEAINYARRVASIKAGDVVKLPAPGGDRLMEVVFTGTIDTDNNCPQFLVYDAKFKRLGSLAASWHAIVL